MNYYCPHGDILICHECMAEKYNGTCPGCPECPDEKLRQSEWRMLAKAIAKQLWPYRKW